MIKPSVDTLPVPPCDPPQGAFAQAGQIPSLDGLRAVSILLVLLSHAGVSAKIPGGFGVTIFFFLSGYLITTLLVREYFRFGTIGMRNFYLRRALRLTPPLLLTLLAAALLALVGVAGGQLEPMTLLSQVFFFYNYYALYGGGSIDGLNVLWSLSVEEHFYILWPSMFLLLMRRRIGLVHLTSLLALIVAWRAIRYFVMGATENAIYMSTDTRMDSLLFGCLLALLQLGSLKDLRVSPARMYAILGLCLAILLLTFTSRDPAFRSTLRYSVQGLALMPIFYFAVTCSQARIYRPLNWAVIRQIGVWSYTIYLSHLVIIKALEKGNLVPPNALVFALLVLVLSCIWSALVYNFAEKPFHRLRRTLSGPATSSFVEKKLQQ